MRLVPGDRLGYEMGLTDGSGTLALASLADLIRRVVHTWRLANRREVLRLARNHLSLLGIADPSIPRKLLDRLLRIGDLAAVHVGDQELITSGEPRWIQSGPSVATLLGLPSVPEGVARWEHHSGDVLLRVQLDSDTEEILEALQVRRFAVREFLVPPPYLEYLEHRGIDTPSDVGLADYWWHVVTYANATGLLLSGESDIRIIAGQPGGFFGRHRANELEGRWTDQLRPGSWLGYRRGYSNEHWHPALVICGEDSTRVSDLMNHDELRWLLLAKGRAEGPREIVHRSDDLIRFTSPLPTAVRSALEVLGPNAEVWKWEIGRGVEIPFPDAFDIRVLS